MKFSVPQIGFSRSILITILVKVYEQPIGIFKGPIEENNVMSIEIEAPHFNRFSLGEGSPSDDVQRLIRMLIEDIQRELK